MANTQLPERMTKFLIFIALLQKQFRRLSGDGKLSHLMRRRHGSVTTALFAPAHDSRARSTRQINLHLMLDRAPRGVITMRHREEF
jgi:hypothetical protein